MTDRAYIRISLDKATSGSVDKQEAALTAVADPADTVIYRDRSVSGATPFAERPGGKDLLRDLVSGDRVLVHKIDRAARDVGDLLNLVKHIRETGAVIEFVGQRDIVTEGPMGDLLLAVLGAVAQFERDLIKERRKESLAVFREEGRHAVGAAPYGLMSVPNPDPGKRGLVLRPDPEQAPALRDAVEQLRAGAPQAALAAALDMGAPTFSRLLRNERLAGVASRAKDGTARIDPDQRVFTATEWTALQDLLADRPAKTWSRSTDYGAALQCGACGQRLYVNLSKRDPAYATYRCRGVAHAHKQDKKPGTSIMRHSADKHLEDDFLTRYGSEPVTEEVTISSDAERDEAIAVARMALDGAEKAARDAQSDDEEDAAYRAHKDAKRALRAAEALPSVTVVETRDTGMDHGELWEMLPEDERAAFLTSVGRWVVAPGRAPISEKLTFVPRSTPSEVPNR